MHLFRALFLTLIGLCWSAVTVHGQKPSGNRIKPIGRPDSIGRKDARDSYALLWEISGNGLAEPSYLFGTTHVRDWRAFDFPDSLPVVFRRCDAVAFELHPDSAFLVYLNPPPWTVGNFRFEADRWSIERTPDPHRFGVASPAFRLPFTILQDGVFNRNSEEGDSLAKCFMDLYLYDRAVLLGKKVFGLESIWSQTFSPEWGDTIREPFFEWPDSLKTDKEKARKKRGKRPESQRWVYDRDKLIEVYLQGDIERLVLGEASDLDESEKKEFLARNYVMVHAMDSLMRQHRLFANMGCAHLGGPKGVVQLLRQKGYVLRAMSPVFDGDGLAFGIESDERPLRAWRPENGHFSTSVFHDPFQLRYRYASDANAWIIPDDANARSAYVVEFPLFLSASGTALPQASARALLKKMQKDYMDPSRWPSVAEKDLDPDNKLPRKPQRRRKKTEIPPAEEPETEDAPAERPPKNDLPKGRRPQNDPGRDRPVWDTLRNDSTIAFTTVFPGGDNWHKLRICTDGNRLWLLAMTVRDSSALLRRDVSAFFDDFRPRRAPYPATPAPETWAGLDLLSADCRRSIGEIPHEEDRTIFARLRAVQTLLPDGSSVFARAHDLSLENLGLNDGTVLEEALEPFRNWFGSPRKKKEGLLFDGRYPYRREAFRLDSANQLCTMAFRRGTRVFSLALLADGRGWDDPSAMARVDSIAPLPLALGPLKPLQVDSVGIRLPFPEQFYCDRANWANDLFLYDEHFVGNWSAIGHDESSGAHFVASAHTFNPFFLSAERDSSLLAWTEKFYFDQWKRLVYSASYLDETVLEGRVRRDTLPDGTRAITFSARDTVCGFALLSRLAPRGDRLYTWHAFFPLELDSATVERDFLDKILFLDSLPNGIRNEELLKKRVLEALSGPDSVKMAMALQCHEQVAWATSDSAVLCGALWKCLSNHRWEDPDNESFSDLKILLGCLDTMPSLSRDSLSWKMFLQFPMASEWSRVGLKKLAAARRTAVFDTLFARPEWVSLFDRKDLKMLVEEFLGSRKSPVDTASLSGMLQRPELLVAGLQVLAKRKRDNGIRAILDRCENRLVPLADSLFKGFFSEADPDLVSAVLNIEWSETARNEWQDSSIHVDTLFHAVEQLRETMEYWQRQKSLSPEATALLVRMSDNWSVPFLGGYSLYVLTRQGYSSADERWLRAAQARPEWVHRILTALRSDKELRKLPARFRTEEFGRYLMEEYHLGSHSPRRFLGCFVRYAPYEDRPQRFFVYLVKDEWGENRLYISPGYPKNIDQGRIFYTDEPFSEYMYSNENPSKKEIGKFLKQVGYSRKPHED